MPVAHSSFVEGEHEPDVRHAYRHDGTEIKAWQDKPLKELKHRLKRYDSVDMDVEYRCENETLRCRLIVSTRPDDATLATW